MTTLLLCSLLITVVQYLHNDHTVLLQLLLLLVVIIVDSSLTNARYMETEVLVQITGPCEVGRLPTGKVCMYGEKAMNALSMRVCL